MKCPKCGDLGSGGSTASTTASKIIAESTDAARASNGQARRVPLASIESTRIAAKTLTTTGTILAVLGCIGGAVLIIIGVVDQCPPGDAFCSDYEKSRNIPLAGAGLISILFWIWIGSLSAAIATRLILAADVAERD